MKDTFALDSYDYFLPDNLIAQHAHDPADECKLMVVNRKAGTTNDEVFNDALLSNLNNDYIIFFNNSKVVRARIPLDNAKVCYKDKVIDGMAGELFYLGPAGNSSYEFLVKPGSKLKIGTQIFLGDKVLSIVDNFDYGRVIAYDGDIFALLEEFGQMPLPPYVEYSQEKESAYQPVMAKEPGSVASPTASLHFTPTLLKQLEEKGVLFDYLTLHVGIGTFRPIKSKNIKDFDIHSESCQVDLEIFERIMNYRLGKKKIIGVGTTACRTLESLPYLFLSCKVSLEGIINKPTFDYWSSLVDDLATNSGFVINPLFDAEAKIGFGCKLYITPDFTFRIVDQLITNFHLPKSSLMVLLAGFMGHEFMMKAYDDAVKKNYMFYSFGDAMRIS